MNLPLIPGTLDYNCYPALPQTLYNDMFEKGVAVLVGSLTGVLLQDAEPAVADRDKVWIRTSGGSPVFPTTWVFYNGSWVAKHPVPASDSRVYIWKGSSAAVDTLDGGTAGAISSNTGPFWEIDHDFDQRVPIGVGTLPITSTVLNVGDTGGLEQAPFTISQSNLPAVKIPISIDGGGDAATAEDGRLRVGAGTEIDWQASTSSSDVGYTRALNPGTVTPIDINRMPPYRVVYFIKRTARIWLTQPIT